MELPESAHRLFERPFNAVLTTINPDGSPQTSMVWASREGDEIVMGVEGRRPKVRNIRNDPRVTVLIEDHDGHDARGLPQYLLVRGTASIVGPDIADEFTALMDRQAQRYLGVPKYLLGNQGLPDRGDRPHQGGPGHRHRPLGLLTCGSVPTCGSVESREWHIEGL